MVAKKLKLLLMGLRRSGKSSIRQVIFHGMQPMETLYLESTTKPVMERLNSLADFYIEEIPGQLDMLEADVDQGKVFSGVSSVVYVIDSQDEYLLALQNVVQVIEQAYKVNPKIHFEVLIHKVDGLNEDFQLDTKRDIIQRINDDLVDIGTYDADITFHMTSIFDQSVIEVFSRIIQKLVPDLSALTQLLDLFSFRTGIEKAFLFDATSKIYLATDSSPVDAEIYQVCSDFINVSADLEALYKRPASNAEEEEDHQFCVSTLQNGTVISLSQMLKGLLLVGVTTADTHQLTTLIEFNMDIFREGLDKIYKDRI